MTTVLDRAGAAAHELLTRRAADNPDVARMLRDHPVAARLVAMEAWTRGHVEGIVRSQAALANLHARVKAELADST